MDSFKPKHITRNLHDEMNSDQIFDMDVRYHAKHPKKKKPDPPYRGKGYHDVLGSISTFGVSKERPAADAGRKAASYRANRSMFKRDAIKLNGYNDDSGVKAGPAPEPIRLNRSRRWSQATDYTVARSLGPSTLKVH